MAKLYRKDYVAIAQALHAGMSLLPENQQDDSNWLNNRIILACAERVADVYQRDQANFDRQRFIEWVRHGD